MLQLRDHSTSSRLTMSANSLARAKSLLASRKRSKATREGGAGKSSGVGRNKKAKGATDEIR